MVGPLAFRIGRVSQALHRERLEAASTRPQRRELGVDGRARVREKLPLINSEQQSSQLPN